MTKEVVEGLSLRASVPMEEARAHRYTGEECFGFCSATEDNRWPLPRLLVELVSQSLLKVKEDGRLLVHIFAARIQFNYNTLLLGNYKHRKY